LANLQVNHEEFRAMKAKITFYIGLVVALLNIVQLIFAYEPVRWIGLGVGLFFVFWGLRIGWTKHKNLTLIVGHVALTTGTFVTAYAIYRVPFLEATPSLAEVLDLPLFWGMFVMWGGYCMITHGYCSCAIKTHEWNQIKKNTIDNKSEETIDKSSAN
jgi:hypothetical protein